MFSPVVDSLRELQQVSEPPLRPIDRGFDEYYGVFDGCCNFFNPATPDPVFYKGGRLRPFAHNDQGITKFPKGYYTTDAFSELAARTIKRFAKGAKPFFVHLCYTAPHFPLHAFPEDIERYRGKYSGGYLAMRERRHKRKAELGLFAASPKLSALENKKGDYRYDYDVPDWEMLPVADRRREEARMETYAAMVDRMDRGSGRVLASLEESGVADNTVVMFLSDNGGCASWPNGRPGQEEGFIEYNKDIPVGDGRGYEFVGKGWGWAQNAPGRQFKTWCYEGGIATPMIVRWPGNVASNSITHLQSDRSETNNLAANFPDRVDRHGARLGSVARASGTVAEVVRLQSARILRNPTERGSMFACHCHWLVDEEFQPGRLLARRHQII